MRRSSSIVFFLFLLVCVLATTNVLAAFNTVSYQGVLRQNDASPVPDGFYPVTVSIYASAAGGVALWQESHPSVQTIEGVFTVQLGSIVSFGALFEDHPELYLEIGADTGSGAAIFTPRVPLSGSPYAFHAMTAQDAETVGGMAAGSLEESAEIDADIAAHNADANAHPALEESAEIDADIAAHDADANAHPNMLIDAAQLATGTIDSARLSMGAGSGLDADTVDGAEAAALEESAEIDADIAAHNVDGAAHADIRAEIDADIAAHDANANAHPNLAIDAAQLATGTVDNARLNTGAGNGLDADTVDGVHAAALEESAEIDADIAAHNTDANAHANMNINAAQIVAGTVDVGRLPTGTGANQVATGNHTHGAGAIVSGTLDVARLPVGTGGTQVAAGNHTHNTLTGPGGNPPNAVVVDASGEVGIGTGAPGERLEVNGALKFTGNNAVANETTGVISRAPRVIYTRDTRPGGVCNPAWPANTPMITQTFTLTRPAAVTIIAGMLHFPGTQSDLSLFVDGAERNTCRDSGHKSFRVYWAGVLPAGAHTIDLRSSQATAFGCPPDPRWDSITTTIFE